MYKIILYIPIYAMHLFIEILLQNIKIIRKQNKHKKEGSSRLGYAWLAKGRRKRISSILYIHTSMSF